MTTESSSDDDEGQQEQPPTAPEVSAVQPVSRRPKAWMVLGAGTVAALAIVAGIIVVQRHSVPAACDQIFEAVAPMKELVDQRTKDRDAGIAPDTVWASAYQSSVSNAIADLTKIGEREVGDLSRAAVYYAFALKSGTSDDDKTNAYIATTFILLDKCGRGIGD